MKLILTHEVSGLGTPGDIVEVKDGYGRNFLLPRNLATPWSKGGEKQIEVIRKARKAREIATLDEAKAVKQSLESRTVAYAARAGRHRAGRGRRWWPAGRQAQGRAPQADQDRRHAHRAGASAPRGVGQGHDRRRRGDRLIEFCRTT